MLRSLRATRLPYRAAGTVGSETTEHNKILQYISRHLGSTLVVLPNLIAQSAIGRRKLEMQWLCQLHMNQLLQHGAVLE